MNSSPNLEELKFLARKKSLVEAYKNYKKEPIKYENVFWTEVNEFAKVKLYHLEVEFAKMGSANTVDDWAQDVTIKVWMALRDGQFKGTPSQFYSWLNKITFNEANDAFNELLKQQQTFVGLTVPSKDEHGYTGEEEDNAELYKSDVKDFSIYIPPSVQGDDLWICKLILFGWSYERIGRRLGVSEQAIKDRLFRLRKRIKAEKEEARKKRTSELRAAGLIK